MGSETLELLNDIVWTINWTAFDKEMQMIWQDFHDFDIDVQLLCFLQQ